MLSNRSASFVNVDFSRPNSSQPIFEHAECQQFAGFAASPTTLRHWPTRLPRHEVDEPGYAGCTAQFQEGEHDLKSCRNPAVENS